MSTFGTLSVPNAIAAIAWAPPTLYISSTPASFAATRVEGYTFPSAPGGVHITILSTPATFAGSTFIRTDEGYTAFPPGTYTPAFSSAVTFCPKMIPSSDVNHEFWSCFS